MTGVGAGRGQGAPVIAVGTVHTSEYEDKDGAKRSSLEMRATAVGPDLSRSIVRTSNPRGRSTRTRPPSREDVGEVVPTVVGTDSVDDPDLALSSCLGSRRASPA